MSQDILPIEVFLHDAFVLGEYTTEDGPFADDHFVVLVTRKNGLHEYVANSDECAAILSYLRNQGVSVEFRLSNCAEFRSEIMYPLELAGKNLFDERKAGSGLSAAVGWRTNYELSETVIEYLRPQVGSGQ